MEDTRARILDATVRVAAQGVATITVPAVAREAGVSVPTIYRHFGTKADLLAAVYPYLARRAGLDRLEVPGSVEGFREMVRSIFDRVESLGDLVLAAAASPASEEARRLNMPGRLAMSRRFVATVAPGVPKRDRERLARILVVLVTSSSMRVWRDHLGSSVDQAADDIEWLVRAAIASASVRNER